MRLTHRQVEFLATRVVQELVRADLIRTEDRDGTEARVRHAVTEELQVEDRLNDEVRDLMRTHMEQIRRADVEYHEMFKVIKSRLARERDIIL